MTTTETDRLEELCKIKQEYVDGALQWYKDNRTWPMVIFRTAGVAVIIASLAIPFLAAQGGACLEIGVPVAALVIAVLTALNSFFAWQKTWEKRITTMLTLEGLIALWRTKIDAARQIADANKAYEAALLATQELVESTRFVTGGETGNWFANVKFPEIQGGKKQG